MEVCARAILSPNHILMFCESKRNVEHRTSNVENRIVRSLRSAIKFHLFSKIQCQTLNDYFCFFSAVLIVVTKILINFSVSSSFPIQYSMLDVRCSMFIFFSNPSMSQNLASSRLSNLNCGHFIFTWSMI
jgi:hypothetical protein